MRKFIFALFCLVTTPIFAQLNVSEPIFDGKTGYTIENSAYKLGFTENYGLPSWEMHKLEPKMLAGSAGGKEEWKSDSRVKGYKISTKDISNAGTNLEAVQLFPKEHAKNDTAAFESSFLTSNVLFMSKQLKESIWERINHSFEELAQKNGAVYVISGSIFEKDSLKIKKILNNHVSVPSFFYKLALFVQDGKTVCKCYRFANRIPTDYERNCDVEEFAYNLYQLEADTGLDFFDRDIDANFRQEKMKFLEKRVK